MDFPSKLKELNLPEGSYVVVASGILQAHGIRPTQDIDLIVSQEVYDHYLNQGWAQKQNPDGTTALVNDVFDIGLSWDDPNNDPNLQDILRGAEWIDGVPYANLKRVLKWKRFMLREKDFRDIKLIEDYLATRTTEK